MQRKWTARKPEQSIRVEISMAANGKGGRCVQCNESRRYRSTTHKVIWEQLPNHSPIEPHMDTERQQLPEFVVKIQCVRAGGGVCPRRRWSKNYPNCFTRRLLTYKREEHSPNGKGLLVRHRGAVVMRFGKRTDSAAKKGQTIYQI